MRAAVVNQTLSLGYPAAPVDLRGFVPALSRFQTNLLQQIITRPGLSFRLLNLFDCATARSFCGVALGRKGFVR